MKFSSTTPANTNIFKQAIIKSLNENKQLIFSKKITISQNSIIIKKPLNNINVNKANIENNNTNNSTKKEEKESLSSPSSPSTCIEAFDFPLVEISDIKDIIDIPETNNKLTGIICFFDNRSLFINGIQNFFTNNKESIFIPLTASIYFPLTREKLIMNCNAKFFKDEEKIEQYWKSLSEEEKLQYEIVDKDSIKPNKDNDKDEFIKYFPQEQKKASINFSVLELIPVKVFYTIFPMPQVIAHINKKKFESLLKPHKMPKKFLMTYDKEKNDWNSCQLN